MDDPKSLKCTALRFALSGPIRTDISLDTRQLLGDDGESILTQLNQPLKSSDSRWTVYSRDDSALDIDVENRRERIVKPPYLAKISFDREKSSEYEDIFLPPESNQSSSKLIRNAFFTGLHLHMFAFGYATFRADFKIGDWDENLTLKNFREWVEPLSKGDVVKYLEIPFGRIILQFKDAVESINARLSHRSILKRTTSGRIDVKSSASTSMPLWVHRVYGLRFCGEAEREQAMHNVEDLLFTSSGIELEDLFPRSNISIYVASGNSAFLSTIADDEDPWKRLNDVIEVQNAYFAKADDFDERLMVLVNQISLDKERARGDRKLVKEVDNYAIDIVDSREEVLIFRNDIEDYEGHLDPDRKKVGRGYGVSGKQEKV